MNALEQAIWAHVYSATVIKESLAKAHFSVREAIQAADYAVSELARLRAEDEAAMEEATRPTSPQPTLSGPAKTGKR